MDNKKKMLNMMGKLNPSFINENINPVGGVIETPVNEVGAKMAGIAINRNIGGNDLRTKQITKDAITSLFSKYIGKDIPFFMKIRESDQPTKYQLVEVSFGRDMSMRTENSEIENGGSYVLKLHFYNPTGEEDNAPYAENKKEFISTYVLANDTYDPLTKQYFFNQYAINLFLFAALTIRKAYFNAFPIYSVLNKDTYNANSSIDQAATEQKMKTNLNKQSFRMFPYDSKDLNNRTHDKPEPTEYF